jgi:hypothetical protein
MAEPENLPEFDPSVHETMALYALILNVHETMGTARHLNENHMQMMRANQRSLAHRFVMTEKPLPSVSSRAQILPTTAERIVLRPEESSDHEVKLLIVRVPLTKDTEGALQDAFIELVDTREERWQFLLNDEGLWPYDNVSDLVDDGRHFRLKEQTQPESSAVMEHMSRHIASAGIQLQTSFDTWVE